MPNARSDVLLVGGGLSGGLTALALRQRRPDLAVTLLERAEGPDDTHTWCTFRSDHDPADWDRLAPLFASHWPSYEVRFPRRQRLVATPYARMTGFDLSNAVAAALGDGLHRGRDVVAIDATGATCADGTRFEARLVIDASGQRPSPKVALAYQKFLGLELRLARPHGIEHPLVMDATVRQEDGYRFLYVLPLSPDTLLVEDTRYSLSPTLDIPALEASVLRYVRARSLGVAETIRRETGVLPVILGGDLAAALDEMTPDVPVIGLRGGFAHPTTGYSLPDAQRVAGLIADHADRDSPALASLLRAHALSLWDSRAFYRTLNRMMMIAAAPDRRYRVLQRFYGLSQGLIERFYAARLTAFDKARILAGWPPVPVHKAIQALPESAAWKKVSHA